ncbi:hypothetical protein AMAG_06964 [Allomyces macrogynus ATCC 38327]|uniref:Uncharacterized protein n=1 Tax=Allomyces macrogynus (strain ATCC 38327) TaxID=578462 RepID=A0A0L0SFD7_ALLM3|nr:hypothetical protein AMAG_06964 [Allomyces macrogynus ATCC 38327]|eukprot:KNE61216.1 hypothetical protein AMAG_06964 [Allomyces macrogynus ATCC 38327]
MDAYSDTEVPRGGRASLAVQAARRKYRRDKLNAIKIQELRDLAAGVSRARAALGGPRLGGPASPPAPSRPAAAAAAPPLPDGRQGSDRLLVAANMRPLAAAGGSSHARRRNAGRTDRTLIDTSCDADVEDDDDTASTASDDTLPLSDPTEMHDRAAFLASDEAPSLSPLHISDSPIARLGGPLMGGPDRDTQTLAPAKRKRPVEFDDHVFDDDDDFSRPILAPPPFMRMLASMRPNSHPEPERDAKRRRVGKFCPPGPPSDSSDTESDSEMPDLRTASLLRSPLPPPPPVAPAPPAHRGVRFDLAANTVIEFSDHAADRMDVDEPPPAASPVRPKEVPAAAPTSAPSPPAAVGILTWIRRSYTLPPVTRALAAVAQAMLSPPRKPVTVGSLADGPAPPAHAAGSAAAACLL